MRSALRFANSVSWTTHDLETHAEAPYEFLDLHDGKEASITRLTGNLFYPVVHVEICQCSSNIAILESAMSAPKLQSVELQNTLFDKQRLTNIADTNPSVYFWGTNQQEHIEFNQRFSHNFPRDLNY